MESPTHSFSSTLKRAQNYQFPQATLSISSGESNASMHGGAFGAVLQDIQTWAFAFGWAFALGGMGTLIGVAYGTSHGALNPYIANIAMVAMGFALIGSALAGLVSIVQITKGQIWHGLCLAIAVLIFMGALSNLSRWAVIGISQDRVGMTASLYILCSLGLRYIYVYFTAVKQVPTEETEDPVEQ